MNENSEENADVANVDVSIQSKIQNTHVIEERKLRQSANYSSGEGSLPSMFRESQKS